MTADLYERWLAERRALFVSRGDRDGVHLCHLALVQHRATEGPEQLIAVATPILKEMNAERSLFGIEVLGLALIDAGLELGAQAFVTEVATLVGRSGREAIISHVVCGLMARSEAPDEPSRARLRAALEVCVAGGEFDMGARVLEALAGHHEERGQPAVAALCFKQAGLYAQRCGQHERATALISAAQALTPERGQPLMALAQDCLKRGELSHGVDALLAGAQRAGDEAAWREALALVEGYLSHEELQEDVTRTLALHQLAVSLCEQLSDEELAESHRVRAQLIALCGAA